MRKVSIFHNEIAVKEACTSSKSISEALGKLGFRAAGSNYNSLRESCRKFNIQAPQVIHKEYFYLNSNYIRVPDELVFAQNSSYKNSQGIKSRMIKRGIPYKCSLCPQDDVWNNKLLVLQLDHINGIHNDNRIENLRFLCPNCHSQTDTFAGRQPKNKCLKCEKNIGKKNQFCRVHACKHYHTNRDKIVWPSHEELANRIRATSRNALAKVLGVSETAIRKRLKAKNIII